jgi:hypothetical protein
MRLRSLLTTLAFLAASTLYAKADTVFDVTGYMPTYGTVSGTVTINTVTGAVDDADIFLGVIEFNQNLYNYSYFNEGFWFTQITVDQNTPSPVPPEFDTELPIESLIGFTGGQLCSTDYPGPGGPSSDCGSIVIEKGGLVVGVLEYGALEPATPSSVPEPSTLALFATGLLGLAGASRRKLPH